MVNVAMLLTGRALCWMLTFLDLYSNMTDGTDACSGLWLMSPEWHLPDESQSWRARGAVTLGTGSGSSSQNWMRPGSPSTSALNAFPDIHHANSVPDTLCL